MPIISPPITIIWLFIATFSLGFSQDVVPVKLNAEKVPVKLACVGDSITQGLGVPKGQSWPSQIQRLLGDTWEVSNFGVSGRTLLNAGDHPYQKDKAFLKAKDLNPDVVVIMLGTNDTKPHNWKFKNQFISDYLSMVKQFAELPSRPRIFICYPSYIPGKGNFGISEENTLAEIPMIDQVAKSLNVDIIDVHRSLIGKDDLIPDRVHPNADGAAEIAKAIYTCLTGRAAPAAIQK